MKKLWLVILLCAVPLTSVTAQEVVAKDDEVVIVEPRISIPKTLKARKGRSSLITAETNGARVRWMVVDPAFMNHVDLIPLDERTALEIVFVCDKAGKVRLFAYSAKGDIPSEPVVCEIEVVKDPNDDDIDDDDVDPEPQPVPPPANDLKAKVVRGFKDSGNLKSVQAADAKILFGVVVALATSFEKAPDKIPSLTDFHDQFKEAAQLSGWTAGRYPDLARLVKDEFTAKEDLVNGRPVEITDAERKVIISKLRQMADGARSVINEGSGK